MNKTAVTLYQHAWTARDYEPDGSCYGSETDAKAAEVRSARDLIKDESAADIAQALEHHGEEEDTARLDAVRAGSALTDDEALTAAEDLCDYNSHIYPVVVQVDTLDLLRAIVPVAGGPSAAAMIEVAGMLAKAAIDRWERGDLAAVVAGLDELASDLREAFPGLDFSGLDDDDDEEDDTPELGTLVLDESAMAAYGDTPDARRADIAAALLAKDHAQPAANREEAEIEAMNDHAAVVGTVVKVVDITGYFDEAGQEDLRPHDGAPPFAVIVQPAPRGDIIHWNDEHLDARWNVEPAPGETRLYGLRSLWVFGRSYVVED